MTHFTVLVRFEGDLDHAESLISNMLAPYDENLQVPRYKNYLDKDDLARMQKHYNITDLKRLVRKMKDWSGETGGIDSKGIFHWSTYNPKSKWDWYSIGGRWSGKFQLKDHSNNPSRRSDKIDGIEGTPGVFKNKTGIDIAYAKDIDWEGMEKRSRKDALYSWRQIEKALKDPKCDKTKLWLNYDYEGENKEDYIGKRCAWSTFAVLDKDGWHEPAEMGWFACDHDRTESEQDWTAKFNERFLTNFKKDTIVALVDCHI